LYELRQGFGPCKQQMVPRTHFQDNFATILRLVTPSVSDCTW